MNEEKIPTETEYLVRDCGVTTIERIFNEELKRKMRVEKDTLTRKY